MTVWLEWSSSWRFVDWEMCSRQTTERKREDRRGWKGLQYNLRRPLPNRCNSCHSHYMKIHHISYCDNTSSPLTCRVHRVHHTKVCVHSYLFLLLFEPFQYCSWIMAGWTFPLKLPSWVVFLHCTMIISVYIIYFSSFLIIFLLYSSSSSS